MRISSTNPDWRVIDFFSRNHEGIFTRSGRMAHLHILESDDASGHVDEVALDAEALVILPALGRLRFDDEGTGALLPSRKALVQPFRHAAPDDSRGGAMLNMLSRDLGICLSPEECVRLCSSRIDSVDAFADVMFVPDGLDPDLVDRHLWRQVRDRVAEHFRDAEAARSRRLGLKPIDDEAVHPTPWHT